MWLVANILILILGLSEIDLFVGISDLTNYLHSRCLNFTPESPYRDIYSSLVCGSKLENKSLVQNLKNLGIYHVIVVSGSHLVFLSLLLEKIFYSARLRYFAFASFSLLTFYALTTGAEPPVIRALLSISVDGIQRRFKLFWNSQEVIFISLLLCFALFDPWETSYSLLLSYVASCALNLSHFKKPVTKNLLIYILIFPFLLPLSAPNPLSFITNITLAPLISVFFFPLSFLAFFIPEFHLILDSLWKYFLYICALLGPYLQTLNKFSIPLSYLWILAILINFYGIYSQKKFLKNKGLLWF